MSLKIGRDGSAEINLHGLTVFDAETQLIEALNGLPDDICYLDVIHGYSHGTGIKKMVKNEFYHWRISAKHASLNPGSTRFILK